MINLIECTNKLKSLEKQKFDGTVRGHWGLKDVRFEVKKVQPFVNIIIGDTYQPADLDFLFNKLKNEKNIELLKAIQFHLHGRDEAHGLVQALFELKDPWYNKITDEERETLLEDLENCFTKPSEKLLFFPFLGTEPRQRGDLVPHVVNSSNSIGGSSWSVAEKRAVIKAISPTPLEMLKEH